MLTGHVDLLSRSEFVGWAANLSDPDAVVPVVVHVNGRVMGRFEASLPREDLARLGQFGRGAHGFAGRFTPALSTELAHSVAIAFEVDGRPLMHGRTRFYPATIPPEPVAAAVPRSLRPLLITSLGRSGSTLLMHRLRRQAQIVVPGDYPYENRLAAYGANVYRVLTAFDEPGARTNPNLMATAQSIGALPFDSPLQRFPVLFRARVPNMIGNWARDMIATYYAAEAREGAHLFAEKCNFSGDDRVILRSLFPDLLEIVLVRELRDLFCSSRAFWELDEQAGLGRLSQARQVMLDLWRNRPPGVLLLRYEDLVGKPRETGQILRQFLALQSDFPDDRDGEASLFASHGTTPTPQDSIERWRGESLPESVRSFVAESQSFNSAFGYAP